MHRQLLSSIPPARIRPYEEHTKGGVGDAGELYRWNSALSLALFDDIGVIEIAMRSAMAKALTDVYGDEWFKRGDLFDDETAELISQAWIQGRLNKLDASTDVVHGKFVSSFMLGFWVKLLGRGSVAGAHPLQVKRVYDDLLWKPALHKAFPNVGQLERAKVSSAAGDLRVVRNRLAHHEHIIWGIPVYGQEQGDRQRRIRVSEAAATCRELAGYVDADLELWLSRNSQVARLMNKCPVPRGDLLL